MRVYIEGIIMLATLVLFLATIAWLPEVAMAIRRFLTWGI